MADNKLQKYQIISLSDKGHGEGSILDEDLDKMYVIPGTIPGEIVKGFPYRKGKKIQVRYKELIESSEKRVTPICIHYEECGGCSIQHIAVSNQHQLKKEKIESLFKQYSSVAVNEIIHSSHNTAYRNKMEFSFSKDIKGNIICGLFKKHFAFSVLALHECHLVPEYYMIITEAVRQWAQKNKISTFIARKNKGTLRTLTIRHTKHTDQILVMLTVSGDPDDKLTPEQQNALKDVISTLEIEGKSVSLQLRIQQAIAGKATQMFEMTLVGADQLFDQVHVNLWDQKICIPVQIGAQSFFQPNTYTYELLYQTAVEMADIKAEDTVLDLYCGSGIFGLLAAHKAHAVYGADISAESIFDANENAKALGFSHAHFKCMDAHKMLKHMQSEGIDTIDVLFIDPPRAGLGESVTKLIAQFNPRKIVYISCNPNTQIVDVNQLLNYNYDLAMLQPVDQFPHTSHIENIALLNKRGL